MRDNIKQFHNDPSNARHGGRGVCSHPLFLHLSALPVVKSAQAGGHWVSLSAVAGTKSRKAQRHGLCYEGIRILILLQVVLDIGEIEGEARHIHSP